VTALRPLACPGCNGALEPTGVADERVLCCASCPTAVDIAHAGLQGYPVRVARGKRGIYWLLRGDAEITTWAASEAAKTPFGSVNNRGQKLPFTIEVPCAEADIAACHGEAVKRAGSPFALADWHAPAPTAARGGVYGRHEAERVAHQVLVTLITRADGSVFALDLALHVTSCMVIRVE
jgi:hypothetical protein